VLSDAKINVDAKARLTQHKILTRICSIILFPYTV
jgi:hypothetical protein